MALYNNLKNLKQKVNIRRINRRRLTDIPEKKAVMAITFVICIVLVVSHSIFLEFVKYVFKARNTIRCEDTVVKPYETLHGAYWILYNYFPARRTFHCNESITFTTHGDLTYLDNLEPLLKRWDGPVSLAMYAPGGDLYKTLHAIRYAQDCMSPLVREYVTFHIYCDYKYLPKHIPQAEVLLSKPTKCNTLPPWKLNPRKNLFRYQKKLLYPINVARNIAREAATTYYVLACDIELYPNPGLIKNFLNMVTRRTYLLKSHFYVYPLHLFEIEKDMNIPETKTELINMLRNGTANVFHARICHICHAIPGSERWLSSGEKQELDIVYRGKRKGDFSHWEPIFIGTRFDPPYDERLTWEGRYEKMTQAYIMCLQNYDFLVLDNAFLVHKPGIKTEIKEDTELVRQTKKTVLTKYLPELTSVYGHNKNCVL